MLKSRLKTKTRTVSKFIKDPLNPAEIIISLDTFWTRLSTFEHIFWSYTTTVLSSISISGSIKKELPSQEVWSDRVISLNPFVWCGHRVVDLLAHYNSHFLKLKACKSQLPCWQVLLYCGHIAKSLKVCFSLNVKDNDIYQ